MKVGKKHSKSSTETFAERLTLNPIGSLRRRSDFYLDFRRLSLSLVRRLEKRETSCYCLLPVELRFYNGLHVGYGTRRRYGRLLGKETWDISGPSSELTDPSVYRVVLVLSPTVALREVLVLQARHSTRGGFLKDSALDIPC